MSFHLLQVSLRESNGLLLHSQLPFQQRESLVRLLLSYPGLRECNTVQSSTAAASMASTLYRPVQYGSSVNGINAFIFYLGLMLFDVGATKQRQQQH